MGLSQCRLSWMRVFLVLRLPFLSNGCSHFARWKHSWNSVWIVSHSAWRHILVIRHWSLWLSCLNEQLRNRVSLCNWLSLWNLIWNWIFTDCARPLSIAWCPKNCLILLFEVISKIKRVHYLFTILDSLIQLPKHLCFLFLQHPNQVIIFLFFLHFLFSFNMIAMLNPANV